jgi:farnesyl-diphosphate farnesyltransferase
VLHPALSRSTSPAERDLVKNLGQVLRITASFSVTQRAAINRCLRIMTGGMHQFQSRAGLQGLADVSELDRYCYFVAGVVGEMLTELFCDFSADIALRRQALRELQVSFGQALQMVNILKNLWDDRSRGVVWYPRDVFARHGFDLATLAPGQCDAAFADGLRELIAVAHAHLRNALAYICLIPGHEIGIRTFCAWALQLAVLTLGNLHQHPHFASSDEIKVSRAALARVIALSNLTVGSNSLLTAQFNWLARGLPLSSLGRPAAPVGVEMRATTAA